MHILSSLLTILPSIMTNLGEFIESNIPIPRDKLNTDKHGSSIMFKKKEKRNKLLFIFYQLFQMSTSLLSNLFHEKKSIRQTLSRQFVSFQNTLIQNCMRIPIVEITWIEGATRVS